MNDKKICFITCVNDEAMYQESVFYINQLAKPEGLQLEMIAIRNSKCLTEAYNQAMQESDAKYKVYLHQDVFIVNKNFIPTMLNIFKKHDEIGMIGIVGTEMMPTSAYWWESDMQFQHVSIYESSSGQMLRCSYTQCEKNYANVAVIDGVLMMTQYDITWREDLFDGWHFYDMSQSVEFLKKGYQIAVLNQLDPWCIHDCKRGSLEQAYEKYRNLFLDEYSYFLFPLVSILIPTYNRPAYFKIAFESAIGQTYRNIEVIVCDNSTNEETAAVVEPYLQDPRVKYIRNRGVKTKEENFQKFRDIAKGEYLNWLMDDDLFAPDKIAVMMQMYLEHKEVSLVTSYRQCIDAIGNPMESIASLDCEKTSILDGQKIGKKMLLTIANFIGEPTTVLIKRSLLQHHYWNADCRGYKTISDVVMWLELLQKGHMAYFVEPLSSFRRHAQQEQAGINVVILSRIEWFNITKEAFAHKYFIENMEEYQESLMVLWKDSIGLTQAIEKQIGEVDKNLYKQYQKIVCEIKKTLRVM